MKRTIKKLQLNAERIRTLTPDQLRIMAGGARPQSNTDEMGECICITQISCPWTCPPPPPF